MTAPTILLEAYLGGAWQDLTGSLLASHGRGIRISRGRANEAGSAQPGRCEFALESRTGEWTEGSPASHPDWAAGARVRVTVNGTVRFAGTISSPVTRWPDREDALHAVTTVTATDVIADLAAAPLEDSVASLLVRGLAPSALWPLDDPAGSMSARSLVAGVPPMWLEGHFPEVPLSDLATFGSSPPEGLRTGSWVEFTPVHPDPAGGQSRASLGAVLPSTSRPLTVLVWWLPTELPDPAGPPVGIVGAGKIGVWQLPVTPYITLKESGGGPSADLPAFPLGVPVLLAMTIEATTATLRTAYGSVQITMSDPGAALADPVVRVGSAVFPYSVPPWTGWGAKGRWSTLAVVPGVVSESQLAELSGRGSGQDGPVSLWLQRALDSAGGGTMQVAGYDRPMIPLADSTVGGFASAMADAAGAMWVADRDADQPTWIDPRWVGPVTALPGEAVDLDRLEWAADRSLRVTDVTSEGRLLASSGLAPRVTRDLAPLLRPIDLQGRAEWLANTGGVMGSPRLGGVGIDLLTWPWETSQLNLAANPGFESVGSLVEIWRNNARNPRQISGGSTSESLGRYSWTSSYLTGLAIPGSLMTTAVRLTCPAEQTGSDRGVNWGGNVQLGSPLASGDWLNYPVTPDVPISLFTRVRLGLSGDVTVRVRYHDGAGNWVGASQSPLVVPLTAGVWAPVQINSLTPPAGATHVVFGMFINATSGTFPAGIAYDQTACCVAQAAAPTYFDYAYNGDDNDLTPFLASGTIGNGPSILTAPGVANVNAAPANVKTYSSTAWAKDGARSVRTDRIAPGATNHWTVFPAVPNVTGQLYTVLLCLRTVEPVPVAVLLDRTGLPSITFYSGSVAGEVIVRGTFTGNAAGTNPRLSIQHNGTVGQVIWMDCYAVIEGDYAGGWFPDTLPGTADLLALDLRHRVRISDPPPQVPSVLRTATVEGYEETIALDQWGLNLNLAPDPRGIWGDPVQGVLGAAAGNRYGT